MVQIILTLPKQKSRELPKIAKEYDNLTKHILSQEVFFREIGRFPIWICMDPIFSDSRDPVFISRDPIRVFSGLVVVALPFAAEV